MPIGEPYRSTQSVTELHHDRHRTFRSCVPFVRSLAGALVAQFFRRRENFGGAKIFEKKVRAVAIDSVQISSKSELSSRLWSRLKFENFARHFLVNLADRTRIGANLIMIRPNPGTIGRIQVHFS